MFKQNDTARIDTHKELEMTNHSMIVGADECGYGALAGELVVCAVKAPREWFISGLNDSKKLSAQRRQMMSDQLEKLIIAGEIKWALSKRSNIIIDQLGVVVALKQAYVECFQQLTDSDSLIIVDGNLKFDNLGFDTSNLQSLIKADTTVSQVMAASILGKVYRDHKMRLLHHDYPVYGWDRNVGYPTAQHLIALNQHGPSPLHRFSYAPVQKAANKSI
jgi:ribonuclease HII